MEHLHLSLCICTCMELADLQTHVFFLFSRLLVVLFFVFFCGVGASKPEKLWKSSILASRPGAASVSLPSHNALPAHSSSAEIGNFFWTVIYFARVQNLKIFLASEHILRTSTMCRTRTLAVLRCGPVTVW